MPKKTKKKRKSKEKLPFPKMSKSAERLMDLTFARRCRLWFENFALNLATVREGKDVMELPKFKGEPCIIVGGGPSIWKYGHLDLLEKWHHPILSCDKLLIELLKRGIKPNITSSIDAVPMVEKFYDDPIVDKYKDDVKAVLIATIHPNVVKRCPFEKYWYVNIYDDPRKPKSLTAMFHFMSKEKTMLVSVDYNEPVILVNPAGRLIINRIGDFEKNVKNIEGWKCVTLNPSTFKLSFKPIKALIKHTYNGWLYEITVDTGRTIKVTEAHSLFTLENGEILSKEVKELKKGDYLVTPKRLPRPKSITKVNLVDELLQLPEHKIEKLYVKNIKCSLPKRGRKKNAVLLKDLKGKKYEVTEETVIYRNMFKIKALLEITPDLCKLLGWFAAEGSYGNSLTLTLGVHEKEDAKEIRQIITKVFGIPTSMYMYIATSKLIIKFGGKYFNLIFKDVFSLGSGTLSKTVPTLVLNTTRKNQVAFLTGYFRGDGYPESQVKLCFKTSSQKMLERLPYLLLLLDTNPCIYNTGGSGEVVILGRHCKRQPSHKVVVMGQSQVNTLGLSGEIKKPCPSRLWIDRVPTLHSTLRKVAIDNHVPRNLVKTIFEKRAVTDTTLRRLIEYFKENGLNQTFLLKFLERDIAFLKIKKIRKMFVSSTNVYDLAVENFENFVGGIGGFICHNSMGNVGSMLWNLSLILGCKPIILLGFDYSYDDLDITKASYYRGILGQVGGDKEKAKKYFSIRENPVWKNKYLFDLIWKSYREIFAFYINKAPILTINASEQGSLHPPTVDVKCMRFRDAIEKFN